MNMEALLLHLVGDYLTQTNRMATRKTSSSAWALAHALAYGLPFLMLGSWAATLAVVASHFLVDRFRLVRFVVFAKNKVTEPGLRWKDCSATGYHVDVPAWMAVWLMIIADNTLHLCANWAALRWL